MASGNMFSQAPTLTLLNSYSLTPNTTDTIGAFARVYYHQPRNKFYITYSARQAGSTNPAGMLSNFAWREYDANMNFTGNKGSLPGFTGAGDYAMVQVDSTYYHLTNLGSTTTGILKFKLTKLDDDFNSLATATVTLNAHDNNIDQLMNYANGRLIIGAMHDSSASPPVTPPALNYNPNINLYQYDLNLNSIAPSKVLLPKSYSWGGSCIYDNSNSNYYIIADKTTNQFATATLTAYKYDNNFNYLSSTQLSTNGQWAQGVIWDGQYYYVAYHTGAHNRGNILLGIFTPNWTNVSTYTVTNFAIVTTTGQSSYNAQRPFLTKVGSKLYLSYDIESYTFPVNEKNWQSGLKVFQINGSSGMEENYLKNNFNLYPNPASNELTIELTENTNGEVSIYNVSGELVIKSKTEENSKQQKIDITELPNGLYLCKIVFGSTSISKRFIKN